MQLQMSRNLLGIACGVQGLPGHRAQLRRGRCGWEQVEVAAAGSEVVAAPSLVTTSRRAEIHHVFRAPDRRTPAFISIFFSALQVQPLLLRCPRA